MNTSCRQIAKSPKAGHDRRPQKTKIYRYTIISWNKNRSVLNGEVTGGPRRILTSDSIRPAVIIARRVHITEAICVRAIVPIGVDIRSVLHHLIFFGRFR